MSKVVKEMLKTIISNQELMMKHLNVKAPGDLKIAPKKTERKKSTKRKSEKKAPEKKRK